jgi:hypothetical protein
VISATNGEARQSPGQPPASRPSALMSLPQGKPPGHKPCNAGQPARDGSIVLAQSNRGLTCLDS